MPRTQPGVSHPRPYIIVLASHIDDVMIRATLSAIAPYLDLLLGCRIGCRSCTCTCCETFEESAVAELVHAADLEPSCGIADDVEHVDVFVRVRATVDGSATTSGLMSIIKL
jgi:hypothetical protein